MLIKTGRFICLSLCAIFIFSACGREEVLLDYEGAQYSETSEEEASGVTSEISVYIHVCGAVEVPGVYELPEGSRICDAVEAAGGFSQTADTESVNLVELLKDGEQIRIAHVGENQTEDSGLININQADVSLLCEIPGIGESRAEAIIAYREENGKFEHAEELMKIPGIKEGLFAKILPYIECK